MNKFAHCASLQLIYFKSYLTIIFSLKVNNTNEDNGTFLNNFYNFFPYYIFIVGGHSLMTSQKVDPTFKKFHFIPSLVNTVHASSHPRSSLCGVTSFLYDHKEEIPLNYSTLPIGVYLNQQTGITMVKNNYKCLKIIKSTFFIMLSRISHSRMMKNDQKRPAFGIDVSLSYAK